MGDERREEDRPIELAFLCPQYLRSGLRAPAFYPLRTEAKVRKGSKAADAPTKIMYSMPSR